jgi:hypothetical protein
MKKLIFMIGAVTLIAGNISAQENTNDFRDQFTFGLKAGANYSNVYSTNGDAFVADPKFGFAAGGFVAIPIGKLLGVQPELLFSQKGFQATGVILGSTYKFTRTTNYIDVPIFFSLKPCEFLTIMAGPQYSYLIKRTDVFGNASTSIEQQTVFENDNIRKNTLCFVGGGDINLKHVVFGARVGWDLMNNNGDGTSGTPSYKNVWYQATIGYRFY